MEQINEQDERVQDLLCIKGLKSIEELNEELISLQEEKDKYKSKLETLTKRLSEAKKNLQLLNIPLQKQYDFMKIIYPEIDIYNQLEATVNTTKDKYNELVKQINELNYLKDLIRKLPSKPKKATVVQETITKPSQIPDEYKKEYDELTSRTRGGNGSKNLQETN